MLKIILKTFLLNKTSIALILFCTLSSLSADAKMIHVNFEFDKKLQPTEKSIQSLENILLDRKSMSNKGVLNFYIKANLSIGKWKVLVRNLKKSLKGKSKFNYILIRTKKVNLKSPIHESFASIYGLGKAEKVHFLDMVKLRGALNHAQPTRNAELKIHHKESLYLRAHRPVKYFRGEESNNHSLKSTLSNEDPPDSLESEALSLMRFSLSKSGDSRELTNITSMPKSRGRMPASVTNKEPQK